MLTEDKMQKAEVTIDLGMAESSEQLQMLLYDALDFPGFYGMNWNAFWDAITGLVEMPSKLILKNPDLLAQTLPEDHRLLFECLEEMKEKYPDIECEVIRA